MRKGLRYNIVMNAQNYDLKMQNIISSLGESKPKVLLHACCAPCSSACLERLYPHFDVTTFFYNPNIEYCEYEKRKAELVRLLAETGWADILECEHDTATFYSAVKGLEAMPEGGARCIACFKLRLERTAAEAKTKGFDYFCSTLTLSPLKNAAAINLIGEELEKKYNVCWLYSDFKKRDGYLRSIQLSKEHSLYRQSFCGCIFSQTLDLRK